MTELVEVAGTKVRVRQSGDPSGDPIVMLHGIGRSLEDWAPQHELLPDTHRVISVDLPGFGFSAPPPGRMTMARLAEGVYETLDALGVQRPAHVFGNLLGGAVALSMQATDPERVTGLVLAAPAGFGQEVVLDLRLLAIPGLGHMLLRHVGRPPHAAPSAPSTTTGRTSPRNGSTTPCAWLPAPAVPSCSSTSCASWAPSAASGRVGGRPCSPTWRAIRDPR
jgi:pimeloyl-ACP methyl ester carboxylesterase